MSRCPFAVQQIIPENYTQPSIDARVVILHRAVSSAESLYNYWNTPGVELESHFYVGQVGTIYQFVDTDIQADANVDANGFAISVETWDGGNTPDDMSWNDAQVQSIKRLLAWLCDEHQIPRVACTSWNGSGIGGHNWFPYPWAGGPRGCPGTARNSQIRGNIIPWLANGGSSDGDDMAITDEDAQKIVDRLLNTILQVVEPGDAINAVPFRVLLEYSELNHAITRGVAQTARDNSSEGLATSKRIETKVNGLSTGVGYTLEQIAQAVVAEFKKAGN